MYVKVDDEIAFPAIVVEPGRTGVVAMTSLRVFKAAILELGPPRDHFELVNLSVGNREQLLVPKLPGSMFTGEAGTEMGLDACQAGAIIAVAARNDSVEALPLRAKLRGQSLMETCPVCKGGRRVPNPVRHNGDPYHRSIVDCSACGGSGWKRPERWMP